MEPFLFFFLRLSTRPAHTRRGMWTPPYSSPLWLPTPLCRLPSSPLPPPPSLLPTPRTSLSTSYCRLHVYMYMYILPAQLLCTCTICLTYVMYTYMCMYVCLYVCREQFRLMCLICSSGRPLTLWPSWRMLQRVGRHQALFSDLFLHEYQFASSSFSLTLFSVHTYMYMYMYMYILVWKRSFYAHTCTYIHVDVHVHVVQYSASYPK